MAPALREPWSGPLVWRDAGVGLTLDLTRAVPASAYEGADAAFADAFVRMAAIEAGGIGNPDEHRRVGHYWLRDPALAPEELRDAIVETRRACATLASEVHREGTFTDLLVIGIGGSALGPQLVADALSEPDDRLRPHFLDNTDPEGIARVVGPLDLEATLVVCISKSGGTPETRNALVEVEAAYRRAGVPFAERAVAVTGEGSPLWVAAARWRARLPMWDWVGGRTSVTSAVGLVPMYLQGVDGDALLAGAAAMDRITRIPDLAANPAARLALAWHHLGGGRGRRAMVVLPYRDRLVLLSRYLQQLVMESLGKALDLQGQEVHQGLAVYGNKGSTDQHAYVQQLRDGPDDHFVTFLSVLDDGYYGAEEVEPGVDAGDYLQGLLLGTRDALTDAGHPSVTLTLRRLDAFHLGVVIALFERAVGLYAARIGINAYHQPGVEAGKKAAAAVIALKPRLLAALTGEPASAATLAARVGTTDIDRVWYLLTRLAENERDVSCVIGRVPADDTFTRKEP